MSHREQLIARLRERLHGLALRTLYDFKQKKKQEVRAHIEHLTMVRDCFMGKFESEYNEKKILLHDPNERSEFKKMFQEHINAYDQEYKKNCQEAIATAEREVAEYSERLWKETEQEVLYSLPGGAFDRLADMHS